MILTGFLGFEYVERKKKGGEHALFIYVFPPLRVAVPARKQPIESGSRFLCGNSSTGCRKET